MYASPELALSQLRLLIHFQEFRRQIVRDDVDTLRLLYLASALTPSLQGLSELQLSSQWRHNLSRLGLVTARHIRSIRSQGHSQTEEVIPRLAALLTSLSAMIPIEMSQNATLYMQVLKEVIDARDSVQKSAVDAVSSLLSRSTMDRPLLYDAFASEVLCDDSMSQQIAVLARLSAAIDLDALAKALLRLGNQGQSSNTNADQYLWEVSYLVWMHRRDGASTSELHLTQAVSALLAHCADDIAKRWDVEDYSMGTVTSKAISPLPRFVHENLAYLVHQDTVRRAIHDLGLKSASGNDFHVAKNLADYAVSMLRAFPSKAANIRMWLYQHSVTSAAGRDVSTIQYFWSTASKTNVFSRITNDHRSVLSVLKEAAPESNQIGRHENSPQAVDLWREEWRVILLFLELYTFILKLMDDDDFFSYEQSQSFGYTETSKNYSQFRKGALPLSDVGTLTTFLKNLAFALYWNVADLKDSMEAEDGINIAALFGEPASHSHAPVTSKAPRQTLTGNGVSHSYLKGLATGLLRTLHERDSRRKFLPKNHWLMTSQIDMMGFIPAVVVEEQKRHEIGDEEDEEDDDLNDAADAADLMPSGDGFAPPSTLMQSMFNIRQPHLPRSSGQKEERQLHQARKKRLIESLAPRLEILRNLPFFFPFETRVQIFREFIFRDQARRRDGYIDSDQLAHAHHATTKPRTRYEWRSNPGPSRSSACRNSPRQCL